MEGVVFMKKLTVKVVAGTMAVGVLIFGQVLTGQTSAAEGNSTSQTDGTQPNQDGVSDSTQQNQEVSYTFDKASGNLTFTGKGVIGGAVSEKVKKEYSYDDGWKYTLTGTWRDTIPAKDVKSVTIQDGITGIDTASLAFLDNVTDIVIPDSVTYIGDYAFGECDSLQKVTVGDGVIALGNEVFWESPVESISLGKNVKAIGARMFGGLYTGTSGKEGCLKTIQVASENPNFKVKSNGLYSKDGKTLYVYPVAATKNVTIAKGTKVIKQLALQGAKMKTVTIPATVQIIEGGAFSDCKSLKKVTFAKNSKLKRVEEYYKSYRGMGGDVYYFTAFGNCTSLKEIRLPDSCQSISTGTVTGCTALEKIYLGKSFAGFISNGKIKSYMKQSGLKHFKGFSVSKKNKKYASDGGVLFSKSKKTLYLYPKQKKGTTYRIPSKVTTIGKEAFYQNQRLKKVIFGKNIKEVKDWSFYGCSKLKVLKMNQKVTAIREWAFANCRQLKEVSWSRKIKKIENSAFKDCVHLKTIRLYGKNVVVDDFGFVNCRSVTRVVWPKSFKKLGYSAFNNCEKITAAVVAGEGLTIAEKAFYNCKKLKKVTIRSGVSEIGNNAFARCLTLKKVSVPSSVKKIGASALGYSKEPLDNYAGKPYAGEKIADFVLEGKTGSAVETYATQNQITFQQ